MRYINLVVVIAAFIMVWGIINIGSPSKVHQAIAKDGFLNLRQHSWKETPFVDIQGEWKFRLIDAEECLYEPQNITLPGYWDDLVFNDTAIGAQAIGMYSIQIALGRRHKARKAPLGLELQSYLPSAYSIMANDKPLRLKDGKIFTDKQSSIAGYTPKVFVLPRRMFQGDTLTIQIMAANHYFKHGGLGKTVRLGSAEKLTNSLSKRVSIQAAIGSVFIGFFVFNLGLFFFFNRETVFLYSAAFCFCSILYILTNNDVLVHFFAQDIHWPIIYSFRLIANVLGFTSFILYLQSFYPTFLNKNISIWIVITGLLLVAAIIISPGIYKSHLRPFINTYAFALGGLISVICIIQAKQRDSNGILLSLGVLVAIALTIHDFQAAFNLDFRSNLQMFGILILVIAQGGVLIRRFSREYRQKMMLSQQLITTNSQLTGLMGQLEYKVKERTDKLAKQNEELLELQQFKRKTTAMIIHDLKNPLQVIMRRHQTDNTNDKITYSAARRMMFMIQNLLDIDNSKQARINVAPQSFNLYLMMESSIERLSTFILDKDVTINLSIPPSISVFIDKNLLERVIDNLIHNAIKYSPQHGGITIGAHTNAQQLRIIIDDMGPGIPIELRKQVFKEYTSHTPSPNSHGLGLSYVKLAMDEIGGTVQVSTSPTNGARFIIGLPEYSNHITPTHINTNDLPIDLRDLFEKCKQQLQQTNIYDVSTIESTLDTLPQQHPHLQKWREVILHHVYQGNEEIYQSMLS